MAVRDEAEGTHVHLYVLLDRSGSMNAMRDDVIGGFNGFVEDQRTVAVGHYVLTLVLFDTTDRHRVVFDAVPIHEVPALTRDLYVPRGGTPLFDATWALLHRASERAAARRAGGAPPEQVIVAIFTDGEENDSKHITGPRLREGIGRCERAGWSFLHLSAAPDAYRDPKAMGLHDRAVHRFAADGAGARSAFDTLSFRTTQMIDGHDLHSLLAEARALGTFDPPAPRAPSPPPPPVPAGRRRRRRRS